MGERDDLYARLRDKYSHPARFPRGQCTGCPRPIEAGDRVTLFGGWYYHADCLEDWKYSRLASIHDIASGVLEDANLKITYRRDPLPGYDDDGMMVDPAAFSADYLAKTRDIPGHPDGGPPLIYGQDWAGTRAELDCEPTDEGIDVAEIQATMQRIVERRIAAGHAAEEAPIRAELHKVLQWAFFKDGLYEASADRLAGIAVDKIVEFFSKPREATDVR